METKIGLLREQTKKEQMAYINNFENFIQNYMNDSSVLFDYLFQHNWQPSKGYEKDSNNYYLRAFYFGNYGNQLANDDLINSSCYVDCSMKELIKKFKEDKGQLKRPLGLWLEYMMVQEYDLIPNTAMYSRGNKGWDFKVDNKKIDMKICFFQPYTKPYNVSIYNRSYVLHIDEIKDILCYILKKTEVNEMRFKELLQKIKRTLTTGNC